MPTGDDPLPPSVKISFIILQSTWAPVVQRAVPGSQTQTLGQRDGCVRAWGCAERLTSLTLPYKIKFSWHYSTEKLRNPQTTRLLVHSWPVATTCGWTSVGICGDFRFNMGINIRHTFKKEITYYTPTKHRKNGKNLNTMAALCQISAVCSVWFLNSTFPVEIYSWNMDKTSSKIWTGHFDSQEYKTLRPIPTVSKPHYQGPLSGVFSSP